jgi:hypothetical protein
VRASTVIETLWRAWRFPEAPGARASLTFHHEAPEGGTKTTKCSLQGENDSRDLLLVCGVCGFRDSPAVTARRVAVAIVLIVLVALIFAAPRIVRWLAIDSCLDQGGGWDYAAERCVWPET